MTMSKVNAYKNIQLHDILLTTANNNNNNNKRNNKKYCNYTYKYNKFKRYNNNNKNSNNNDDKKIEKKFIKSSDSNKIYEVVEAKKCIETQIYVQTQREGGTFEASSAAFPLKHPWPHNKLIPITTATTTIINSHEQKELKKKGEEDQQKQQAVICDNKTDIDTEDRMQWCAKLRQTWRRISSRTWCSIDASLWHDAAFRIIVMLFVAAVAISGTAEVSAAHRSTHKHESDVGVNKNKNEIPFGFNDLVNSNANTNINNFDYANTLAMSSTTSMVNDSSATGSVSYTTTSVTAASILSSLPAIQIPSGSLQKVTNSGGNGGGGGGSGKGVNRNSIEIGEENRNSGPYFDKSASKNVTALLGKTAYLNCRVKNLGNKTMLLQVSWVRHRDIHLLTVGRYTYTSDQRFRAIHQPQTEDWLLQIKYPQHRDSGIYECQVSTTPHMSHYIHLNVVEPSTEIIGAPDLYIESGSTINLTCVIWNSPEPPAYIFWNHNNAIINYDSPRGGVSVVTLKGETTTSFLLIKAARPSDSGHYQCNPSNAKPKSVTVHVLNGVSHSVSREIPSSNAARGTIASTNDAKSNTICVPVYILLHFSILQTLMALEKSVAENCWLVLKGLSRLLISQLISDLIFYKFKHFIHKLLYLKCFWSETLVSQTDQCLKLKNEFDIR